MSLQHGWKRTGAVVGVFVVVWLVLRYLYPLFLPFLLGLILALAAEPLVKFLHGNLHLGRGAAVFASVSVILGAFAAVLALAGAFLVRRAAGMAAQAAEGLSSVRDWAVTLAGHAPGRLAEPLTRSVRELFTTGGGLLDRSADAALGLARQLPGSLVTLGTAVLSAYLICARLPALRSWLERSALWQRWRGTLTRLARNGRCWLKAQVKLSAVTFVIVLAGFCLLRIRRSLILAALTAVVDAVPLLGTGTVLLPWALFSAAEGRPVLALGLLGIYVTALVTRSALEPKLVGRQLGLDPLAALIALYTGYRLWGFGGMILAPILTVTARELCRSD